MLKKLLIVLVCGLTLGGCNLNPKKSGIEIMSYPTAKVFIDGKEAGMTPYKNVTLKPKEVEVRLEARNSQWTRKVELKNNVNTVIDWEFGDEGGDSGGYLLFMEKTGDEKKSGLMLSASPDKAAVSIDGEIKGFAPMRIENIGSGDKQVTVSFPGYKSINVFVKAVNGYQLVVEANLVLEKVSKVNNNETESNLEPIISATENKQKVKIKETETGWLNVREASSSASREIQKINPGEEYELLEEGQSWYKINLGGGKTGWISAKYADKIL